MTAESMHPAASSFKQERAENNALGQPAHTYMALSNMAAWERIDVQRCSYAVDGVSVQLIPKEMALLCLLDAQTVYLMFQLDLDVQLQRSLNINAFDRAQEIRNRRQKVCLRRKINMSYLCHACAHQACSHPPA
eukprot:363625-Chlamydomonas_euryale.AAC.9